MSLPVVREKRILLAEDETSVRETYALLLGLDDHIVTEARDGTSALALFQAGKFDLVITDFVMPGMKGDQLAARIREIAPDQKILMITAFAPRHEMPVDHLLHKPFDLPGLREAIARVLA